MIFTAVKPVAGRDSTCFIANRCRRAVSGNETKGEARGTIAAAYAD